jgi:hypothetical protein
MTKNFLFAAIILLCSACATQKSASFLSDELSSDELNNLDNLELPMEMIMVEELPPPPDADQYSSREEQKAKALADTTIYSGSKLGTYPNLYHNNQNLAFYLEEKITKAKSEFNVTQQGVVKIKFVVERDGSITNPVIEESGSDVLTKHSLSILKQMPKWSPGSLNGWERRSYTTVWFNW